jgi:hypothetical protein
MGCYTAEEIEEQLRYLKNAHNVTTEERERILKLLKEGRRDQSMFNWVKCPVWRLRLQELARIGPIQEGPLNAVFRFLLEGDRQALAELRVVC